MFAGGVVLLAPHNIAAAAVFVVVVFVAVYIRPVRPRGRALGMVAFISYFFTLYLHGICTPRLPSCRG
ncbi:hypothetical protein [Mycobacterium tilburgii]|uniref:hypothetical protein n=1 Tax=Mycobacterium tilburgii TaxID=44467 RepID=UPI0011820183|nr:hypothetical protein [Mycobacterium tilburgii]